MHPTLPLVPQLKAIITHTARATITRPASSSAIARAAVVPLKPFENTQPAKKVVASAPPYVMWSQNWWQSNHQKVSVKLHQSSHPSHDAAI